MLQITYDSVAAGAPDQYGSATDTLRAASGAPLQDFPKATPGAPAPSQDLKDAVAAWIGQRGANRDPVVVMVHGYLFDPRQGSDTQQASPLESAYGVPGPTIAHNLSWLPLTGERGDDGAMLAENAVGFCYRSESAHSEYAFAGWENSYQYAVFDQSPLAARALATVLTALGEHPVSLRILAHSLGTRTTTQAIGLLGDAAPNNLDRIVLLDGAEFCVDAAANYADCAFDVFNFVNGIDKVLALGADQFSHPVRQTGTAGARVIGRDGVGGNPRWLDLALDNDDLIAWFQAGNAPTGGPFRINPQHEEESHVSAFLEHWSCYTNDGNRALIRALLSDDAMTVAAFNARAVPSRVDSVMFGRFSGQAIPKTPQSMADRTAMFGRDAAV